MAVVDRSRPEHATAIAGIRGFCHCPSSCRVIGRVKQDLIRLRLTKGQVLDRALQHIDAGLPIHCVMQTMYFETPQPGYIINPLIVAGIAIYFKVSLPQTEAGEKPYMLLMSVH